MSLEGRIRERAYYLWEREGRPFGRDVELWHQASQEIAAEHGHALAEAEAAVAPEAVTSESVPFESAPFEPAPFESAPLEPAPAVALPAAEPGVQALASALPVAAPEPAGMVEGLPEPVKPARRQAASRKPAAAKAALPVDVETTPVVKKRAPRKPKTPPTNTSE